MHYNKVEYDFQQWAYAGYGYGYTNIDSESAHHLYPAGVQTWSYADVKLPISFNDHAIRTIISEEGGSLTSLRLAAIYSGYCLDKNTCRVRRTTTKNQDYTGAAILVVGF